MFHRVAVAVAALFVTAAVAAPVSASTLTRVGNSITYAAAPGVENDVNVFYDAKPPSTFIISTANDPVEGALPANCSDPDDPPATLVQCTSVTGATVNLGDLDDEATTTFAGSWILITLNGQEGGDTLTGAQGYQTLSGGPGVDILDAGADFDSVNGGPDGDTLDGGDGDDYISGEAGDDEITGEGGDDDIYGGIGDDVVSGGEGNDNLVGTTGTDQVRGDAGDDLMSGGYDELPDVVEGGDGNDLLAAIPGSTVDGGTGSNVFRPVAIYGEDEDLPLPVTIDLKAGTVSAGTIAGELKSIRDVAIGETTEAVAVNVSEPYDGEATILGDDEPNALYGGGLADTIDPRGGADVVNAGDGDDTIDTVDGHSDRVVCAAGNDTITADAYDTFEQCENIGIRHVASAHDVPEDAAPTVAITSPATSAVLSTVAPNTITATATDDKGIKHVVFSTGERTLCVDGTAPYSCDYVPTSADVGRDTLVAVAVDTADQSASAVRTVSVPRFRATSLTAATTPKRDKRAPFKFTTKGKLALPAGVTPAAGCKGTVSVSFKAGKKTVSSRRVALKPDCTYSSKVTFRLPRRLNPKTLSVVVVFGGNEVVEGQTAKRHTVRPR